MVPVPTGGGDAVSCLSVNECVAVGAVEDAHGSALVYAWNGFTWSQQPTPELRTGLLGGFADVSCVSTVACVAVGAAFRSAAPGTTAVRPLVERWNGSHWQPEATPEAIGAADTYLNGVSCASASSCFAVGSYSKLASGANPRPLVERWGGSGWSVQTPPDPAGATITYLPKISCSSTSACTAVGYKVVGTQPIALAERWDGMAWTIENVPSPAGATNTRLYGISCTSDTACTAVGAAAGSGHNDMELTESWDGSNWKIESAPTPSGTTESTLVGVSCVSPTECMAVGGSQNVPGGSGSPLVERWNGSTWMLDQTMLAPAGAGLGGVSCTPDGACTVVGSYTMNYLGGVTQPALWSAQSAGP